MTKKIKEIVLLDLWTDANRGDCALQLGLIAMTKDKWPDANVFGIFRFGANEIADAAPEIPFTSSHLHGFCGGLRRTYYSATNFGRFNTTVAKLISLYSFFEMAALLVIYKLGLRLLLPSRARLVLDKIRHADVVIWKGKNFRDYGGIGGINRQLTLLSAGLLAATLNNNLHCVNASVWPMRNHLERALVRRAFSRCRTVTVREPASLAALHGLSLPHTNVHFAQDLSFYCLKRLYSATGERRFAQKTDFDVGLTITQWGNKEAQQKYLDTLRYCIARLVESGARKFVVIPQVTRAAENSDALIESLRQSSTQTNGVAIEIAEGSPDIPTLLNLYERCSLLIGTRMHSCVFAGSVGTAFIAIAYDAGPKWDILKQFWPARFLFEYGSNKESVATAATELLRTRDALTKEACSHFHSLANASFDNVKFI